MSETLFIVDEYQDRIVARSATQVLREAAKPWFSSRVKNRFETGEQAEAFIISRAEQRVAKAKAELKKAENHLRHLKKRFAKVAEGARSDG